MTTGPRTAVGSLSKQIENREQMQVIIFDTLHYFSPKIRNINSHLIIHIQVVTDFVPIALANMPQLWTKIGSMNYP